MNNQRIANLYHTVKQAFGGYKKQLICLALFGLITGLLEGVGVNALVPLFSFALKAGSVDDFVSRTIIGLFDFFNLEFRVRYLLVFIASLFVLKAALSLWLEYVKVKLTSVYEEKLRRSLHLNFLRAGWPYLMKQKLGYLETILIVDVPFSSLMFYHLSSMFILVISLMIYILVAINISAVITLLTLILGLTLFLLFKPVAYRTKALSEKITELNKEMIHQVSENILGLKVLKSFNVPQAVIKRAAEQFSRLRQMFIKVSFFRNFSNALVQPISLIFICLLFAFFYRQPAFNFAGLVALVYLIQRIFLYFQQLQRSYNDLNEYLPHLESVLNQSRASAEEREIDLGQEPFIFNHELAFQEVGFAYQRQQPVFQNLCCSFKKGKIAGVIGPSGVGKTTLVDLILRLIKPESGKVLLDGHDSQNVSLREWRSKIGYVAQDIFLINDTLEANIRFYDQNITLEQIKQAAAMAQIDDFIETLPDQYQTLAGERGLALSAGQRQRIALARILARQPEILILDEATSSLDSESELKIQEAIKGLKGKMTVIIVAHRLSTVVDADRLLILDQGRVAEQGRPAELFKNPQSYFYKVYNIKANYV